LRRDIAAKQSREPHGHREKRLALYEKTPGYIFDKPYYDALGFNKQLGC